MNMKKGVTFIMLLCLCLLCACDDNNTDTTTTSPESSTAAGYQKIIAKEAKDLMDSGEPYILLDVRTDEEYAEERIDGAILIPDYEISDRAAAELPDKSALILIYCRSGRRSEIAANELLGMVYTNVYDFGGIIDWPYDTVSGDLNGS